MDQQFQESSNGRDARAPRESVRLSYKFQRLREKLRAAIASGELTGKLPGERQLATRFHVNAKTLSKALTDLAAEGLLDRSIGRGTFVRSSMSIAANGGADTSSSAPAGERWLAICDPDHLNSGVLQHLRQINPNLQTSTDTSELRPSSLAPIKAVIDLSANTPSAFLRDLVVRNINVVLVGREPTTYSVHAVLVDRALGTSYLARDMMLMGHRKFLAVERRGQTCLSETIRSAASRYAQDATVDSAFPSDVVVAVKNHGITAVICDSRRSAVQVREALAGAQLRVPEDVSVAAIGSGWGDYPASGYYVHSQQKAQTVVDLLRDHNLKRPTTLWLTGAFVDLKTIAAPAGATTPLHAIRPLEIDDRPAMRIAGGGGGIA